MKTFILTTVAVGLLSASLSAFAGTFFCPEPSSIHAVPATNPYPPSPGFNYVATDEAGIPFQSISPVIGSSAPTISSFDGAAWFNINNGNGNGSGQCFYLDNTGKMQALVAQVPQSIVYEGSHWSDQGTQFYQCTSTNRQDCAFTSL